MWIWCPVSDKPKKKFEIERIRIRFNANGKRQFIPRDISHILNKLPGLNKNFHPRRFLGMSVACLAGLISGRVLLYIFFSAAEPQEDWDQEPTYGLGLWTYGLLLGPMKIVFTILDIRRSDFFQFYTENSKNNLRSKFTSSGHGKCLFVARETRCLWFVNLEQPKFQKRFLKNTLIKMV